HYVTIYLERAMLRYKTVQQEITFDVVNDITISLTSTLSLQDIFNRISSPIRRIVNVESVSIGLYNSEKEELVFVKALMGPLFADLPEVKVKAGQGIAGWVAKHAEPVLVNDVYADSRFYAEPDAESGFQTNSILAVPLIVEKEVVGVLEVINKQVGGFDTADLNLLQAIASPLAIALENASLHAEVVSEKRRIEAIFDNMSEGMLTCDAQGLITSVNDSLLSQLQVDLLDIVGRSVKTAIKARRQDFKSFAHQVLTSTAEVPSLACDVYAEHRADAVPTMVGGAAIREDDGELNEAIFVFSDLRQIREVERMRDDFFHNIVHELRTPLATILMYARLLRKSGDNPEKAARFLNTIERESDRLQMMVRQMLALAKLEAREMQRSKEMIDLNRLFDEIVPPLSDAAVAKGLTFKGDIRPKLPPFHGDREIIYSIFKNLIDNAIKFTKSGAIRVEAWKTAEWLCCEVEDEGIGIPDEAMPNLFKRFYRTQTAVEHGIAGTGLGLYMVKEGIEKHGGTIELRSVVGKGTLFLVRLPLDV
ncbi:MAG: ATP-binding protein, partial [Candidatus Promineifilaceae bacterium]